MVQSLSDKLHKRLTKIMAGLEDKMDFLGILGPLQQQFAVLEGEVKKLMSTNLTLAPDFALAFALAATGVFAKTHQLLASRTRGTQMVPFDVTLERQLSDPWVRNVSQPFIDGAGSGIPMQDGFRCSENYGGRPPEAHRGELCGHERWCHCQRQGADWWCTETNLGPPRRETPSENFQKLSTMHGETTSLVKSHSALLTGFRAKMLEFEESIAACMRQVDELFGSMQALEERQAEFQEGQNRMLDKLEAILSTSPERARASTVASTVSGPANSFRHGQGSGRNDPDPLG